MSITKEVEVDVEFPARSATVTVKVCEPSRSGAVVEESDEQSLAVSESTAHKMEEGEPVVAKEKEGVGLLVGVVDVAVNETVGAEVSNTRNASVVEAAIAFPAMSSAPETVIDVLACSKPDETAYTAV